MKTHRSVSRWLPAASLVLLSACAPAAPDASSEGFERWERSLVSDGAAVGPQFVAFAASAEHTLDVALSALEDPASSEAIVAAAARGVAVRVVTDVDTSGSAAFGAVRAAGIPVVAGNGAIEWQAGVGDTIVRPGTDNRMTHNFAVADGARVFVSTAAPELRVGGVPHLVTTFASADVAKDFGDVFDQMYGGVFATTLTRFGSSLSSDTNNRTRIPMADGTVSYVWFGPQENAIKEVIDRVYSAQASVLISAEQLSNRELYQALRYKAEAGFEVRLLVDAAGANASRSRVADLEQVFAPLIARGEPVSVHRVSGVQVNAAVFDSQASPIDDGTHDASMIVLSHPFVESSPYERSAAGTVSLPAVAFMDGNAWGVAEQASRPDPVLREVVEWILDASR